MRALVAIALLLAGCTSDPAAGLHGRLDVVAAAYPFAWLAQQVGGDRVRVTDLVKPGTEPHDIELSPRQVVLVNAAKVVVYLKGFQAAVDDALDDGRQGLDLTGPMHQRGSDPHVWLDPVRMQDAAVAIGRRLAAQDPKHAAEYDLRAVGVVAALRALHASFQLQLRQCARHDIVTSHAAFGYLAQRYGLVQHAISGFTPDAEPSPARVAEVAGYARTHHVTTIFFESLVDPKVARTVASEIGARTAVLDPIEGVTPTDDYLKVQVRNAAALRTALGCR